MCDVTVLSGQSQENLPDPTVNIYSVGSQEWDLNPVFTWSPSGSKPEVLSNVARNLFLILVRIYLWPGKKRVGGVHTIQI